MMASAYRYVFRLALYTALGVVRFIGKPGSRVVVPGVLIALAFLLRPDVHATLAQQARSFDAGYQPESGLLDVAAIIAVLAAILTYVLASRILAVTLGAFPMPMRPLPPQRRLKATKTEIKPAVVRLAVPPLPKRRA